MNDRNEKKGIFYRLINAFDRITFYLGPDLIFLFILILVFLVLSLIYGNRKFFSIQMSVVGPFIVFLSILLSGIFIKIGFTFQEGKNKFKEILKFGLNMSRDWFPLLLIILIYENLHDLTDLIHPDTLDGRLAKLDELIFGVQPTIYLQRFIHPLINEFMTVAYGLYFVYPASILGIVYSRGDLFKFREVALSLVICVVFGFIGYVTVPAVGPRYFLSNEYTIPLTGYLTEAGAKAWNSIESVKRDCFPSLHTAMSTISLVYYYRLRNYYRGGKVIFYISLPLIISLWISTVYLRYHWVVDVFAGWLLATICVTLSPKFIKWYYFRKTGRVPEVSTDLG